MKLLTAQQIRDWDKFTIENEPILSIDLMERASLFFAEEFSKHFPADSYMEVMVFCGPGNNGGDGFAVARLLYDQGYKVFAFLVCEDENKISADCKTNLARLKAIGKVEIEILKSKNDLPVIPKNAVVIDALFGTGLSRKPEAFFAEVIYAINNSGAKIVSIDVPSGLFTDVQNAENDTIIEADHTFTFQVPKMSFFLCENEKYLGEWKVLDIGLLPEYLEKVETDQFYLEAFFIKTIYRKRKKCSHKGTYGHALIWAGSYGKIGAAVLASKAVLRSGAGLLTAYIPKCGYNIMQTALPEAMCLTDDYDCYNTSFPDLDKYAAVGIGPGIGTESDTKHAVNLILHAAEKPLVLDADALNCISQEEWQHFIPQNSILTPHPKEFDRLAGESQNESERIEKAKNFAKEHNVILVLKGAYTSIHLPSGETYFNTTGNAGMATGGSGDVL
ncbi:MAG: NAD(P)H-hydrate dehydratase, partial [Bacteroidia bacterium]